MSFPLSVRGTREKKLRKYDDYEEIKSRWESKRRRRRDRKRGRDEVRENPSFNWFLN